MTTPTPKTNLLGLDLKGMRAFFESIGEKPFRAQQVLKWIHTEGLSDFEGMTNLSKELRAYLPRVAEITLPKVLFEKVASDGTTKWVIQLHDGNCIESVFERLSDILGVFYWLSATFFLKFFFSLWNFFKFFS